MTDNTKLFGQIKSSSKKYATVFYNVFYFF